MTQSVVIVEDDQDIRTTLQDFLDGQGYRVLTAANGRQALDLLQTAPLPTLILLDLMIPVTDGVGFLAARREDDRLKQIPVVLMTAHMREWNDRRGVGVEHVLPKPFTTDQLLTLLRQDPTT